MSYCMQTRTVDTYLGFSNKRLGSGVLVLCFVLFAPLWAKPRVGPDPVLKIDVTALGFKFAHFESNRQFFRNYTIEKLMALDLESKLITLSESVAVLYATRTCDGTSQGRRPCLQALFINVTTGDLVRRQEWPVRSRRFESDLFDSEGRILSLAEGGYLVMAGGAIYLYGADGVQLRTRILPEGIWAANAVSYGELLFLRRSDWPGNVGVTYEWLDPRTSNWLHRFESHDALKDDMGYRAGAESVTFGMRDGLHEVGVDGSDNVICSDPICRFPGDAGADFKLFREKASERLIFVSFGGLLVASVPTGPSCSRLTGYLGTGPVLIYIRLATVSQSGDPLALEVFGRHKMFDDVALKGKWEYLITT